MHYKTLGRTGLIVSDLCLGTMIFGEEGARHVTPEDSTRMIDRFIDAGGNHIDTANVYGSGGRSEEIVGAAIKGKRDQIVLATKLRFPMGGLNDQGLSRHNIINSTNASLRRLDTDYIDLMYFHCWDPITPIEESMRAIDDLVTAGKIRYVGVSNFKAWQVMKALAVSEANGYARFVAGQYQYSLVKRDIEYEFTDLFLSEGVGLTPWSPLGGGFLTGKYKRDQKPQTSAEGRIAVQGDDTEEAWHRRNTEQNWNILNVMGEIAEEREVTYSQIALAWVRAQPSVSSVILGASKMSQLEDNLGAADLQLTADEVHRLNTVSALPEMYPYRFIESYGARSLS
ncbi:MAG: aldo/keto reductase [bacterium]|nr:aldo/keto reductase [bacterium]